MMHVSRQSGAVDSTPELTNPASPMFHTEPDWHRQPRLASSAPTDIVSLD